MVVLPGLFKLKYKNVLSFFTAVFVFVLMIDPANLIFKLKVPIFSLLLFLCYIIYRRFNIKRLLLFLLFYVVLGVSSVCGIFSSAQYDLDFAIYMYTSFLMTALLLWVNHLKIISYFIYPVIFIFFIVVSIYIIYLFFPELEALTYSFINSNYEGTIIMSRREFLGTKMIGIYYTSIAVCIIPAAYYLYRTLNEEENRKQNLLCTIILILPMLMGATRATMLCVTASSGLLVLSRMVKKKAGLFFAFIISIVSIYVMLSLTFSLATEKTEASNIVKEARVISFFKLISDKPQILICGQGVGALFETVVNEDGEFGKIPVYEITYFELIRWFGIPLMAIFMSIYLYPLYLLWHKKKILTYWYPMMVGYISYLIIAGTNPLLFGSNGFLAMLLVYSYVFNPYYEKRNIIS